MTAAPLRIVPPAPDAEPPIDVRALIRADIRKRDWAAVHIAADRRAPVDLPDPRKWGWR